MSRKLDLLGEGEKPKEPKNTYQKYKNRYQDQPNHEQSPYLQIDDIYRGVSITWLMNAFRMDRPTVKRRVAELKPIKRARGNIPIYDFVQAAEYLVEPKVDIEKHLKRMRPEELPHHLQTAVWDAKLKRQKYEIQAGDLWRTEDVIAVYSEAFKSIKSAVQLWVSSLERTAGMTPDQYEMMERMSGELLEDLYSRLTEMKQEEQTPSALQREAEEGNDVRDS